jgi:hypothetical protein
MKSSAKNRALYKGSNNLNTETENSYHSGKKLTLFTKTKKLILLGLTLLLLAASFPMRVSAQGGGALALDLNPEQGVAGMTVSVTANIPNYLSSRSLDAAFASQYWGQTFALVWDLGGSSTPPSLDTVRTADWQVLSYAHIDNEGMLEGVIQIPNNATEGEHLVTAVYYIQSSDAPLTYFWGYFEVISEGAAVGMLPEWLIYLIVALIGIAVVVAVVVLFLRRRGRRPS